MHQNRPSLGTQLTNTEHVYMCLKLKFIYNKELAHEKQFINSLSCSHYAEFQYHPQC